MPSWSPDGESLAHICYFEGDTQGWSRFDIAIYDEYMKPAYPYSEYSSRAADLCLVDIDGGNQRRIASYVWGYRKLAWSPDGTKIAYVRYDGIYIVGIGTDSPSRLLVPDVDAFDLSDIFWSPNGEWLLFSTCHEHPDRDIYLANTNSGELINLTSESRGYEFNPRWTLNGTRIIYSFTNSSKLDPGSDICNTTLKDNAPYQLETIDADGKNRQIIYTGLIKRVGGNFVASNTGVVAFVSDTDEIYIMDLLDLNLINVPTDKSHPWVNSLSPNGKYLLYKLGYGDKDYKIMDTQTQEIRAFPSMEVFLSQAETPEDRYHSEWWLPYVSWAPDNHTIAFPAYLNKAGEFGYTESHIYIVDLQNGLPKPLKVNITDRRQ